MKTLMSCIAVTALIVMSSFTVNQQQQSNEEATVQQSVNNCFSNFRVHKQGKRTISLNWAVAAPDVSQFVVERSYDGEFFEEVNPVGFNGAGMYKYNDNDVFPGYIHYRIAAVKTDGTVEYSEVKTLRIVQRG